MKQEKTIILPALLVSAIEETGLTRILQGKAFMLCEIILGRAMRKDDRTTLDTYQRLSSEYFTKVFNSAYKNFLNPLIVAGIIDRNQFYVCPSFRQNGKGSFQKGVPKGYRINPRFLCGEWQTVVSSSSIRSDEFLDCHVNLYRTDMIVQLLNGGVISHRSLLDTVYISHIIPQLFMTDALRTDLCSLRYDTGKMMDRIREVAENLSMRESFILDHDIEGNFFEVDNKLTGMKRKMAKVTALDIAGSFGGQLIQDRNRYLIVRPDDFLRSKKRHMIIHAERMMAMFRHREFRFMRNLSNHRLDHPLTNLNRHLLSIVKDDNDLVEIDIANSQFVVHAWWLRRIGFDRNHQDVDRYCTLAEEGRLYEEMARVYSTTRHTAKTQFMRVAFSKDRSTTKAKMLFKEAFPNVAAHMDRVKSDARADTDAGDPKKANKWFSNLLSALEAELMIDRVYVRMKEAGMFAITRHDSILVRKTDRARTIGLIRSTFDEVGFRCVLKVDGEVIQVGAQGNGLSQLSEIIESSSCA